MNKEYFLRVIDKNRKNLNFIRTNVGIRSDAIKQKALSAMPTLTTDTTNQMRSVNVTNQTPDYYNELYTALFNYFISAETTRDIINSLTPNQIKLLVLNFSNELEPYLKTIQGRSIALQQVKDKILNIVNELEVRERSSLIAPQGLTTTPRVPYDPNELNETVDEFFERLASPIVENDDSPPSSPPRKADTPPRKVGPNKSNIRAGFLKTEEEEDLMSPEEYQDIRNIYAAIANWLFTNNRGQIMINPSLSQNAYEEIV